MIKITKENYRGYSELYKLKMNTEGEVTYNTLKNLKTSALLEIITLTGVFMYPVSYGFLLALGIPAVSLGKISKWQLDYKRKLNILKKRFPYLDLTKSVTEIENALIEANVYKNDNGYVVNNVLYYESDLRKEIQNNRKYIKLDYVPSTENISENEKVKTLTYSKKI